MSGAKRDYTAFVEQQEAKEAQEQFEKNLKQSQEKDALPVKEMKIQNRSSGTYLMPEF